MIYIDSKPLLGASAELVPGMIGDTIAQVLIISLPPTALDATFALFAGASEITDEQPQTITRYRPAICYSVADEGGRTYAKLRISSRTTAENPAWYAAQTAAANAENTEMINLIGANVERAYQKRLEELNHV